MAGHKSTAATVKARVRAVYILQRNGADRATILLHASNMGWCVTDRSVQEYIAKATARFVKESETVYAEELGKCIARLNSLHMKAVKSEDHRTALAVQRELSETLGLKAPTKIAPTDPTGKTAYDSGTSINDRMLELQQLLARTAKPGPKAD